MMEKNSKIAVVILGFLGWLRTGAIGFGADPFRSIVELAGSMIGAWIAVSCVLKISAWLKVRRKN